MKNRRPLLTTIVNRDALFGIWYALEGEPSWLANRLRRGTASNAEQALAADLIEGNIKPRRPRRRFHLQRCLEIVQFYTFLKKKSSNLPKRDRQEKSLKSVTAEHFDVSMRHVDNVMAEFDDKALSEIERINNAKNFLHYVDRDTLVRMVGKFARK